MPVVEAFHLLTIFALFFLHLLVPGPNMILLCTCASRGGRNTALAFSLGTAFGTTLWAIIVVLGLWRFASDGSTLAISVKFAAAGALLYFGSMGLVAAWKPKPIEPSTKVRGLQLAFVQGLVTTLTNANELIFWTAALALAGGIALSPLASIVLVAGVGTIALAFDLTLAYLATGGWLGHQLLRFRRPLEASLGGIFWLAGISLLRPI